MLMILTEPTSIPDHVPATNARHAAAAYTVRDVAARLSGSERHVRDLIARGELRAVREGNRWLVLPADLDAYLASLRTTKKPLAEGWLIEIKRERKRKRTA